MIRKSIFLVLLTIILADASTTPNLILKGSGATFPYPLYRKWINVYTAKNDIQILYEPVGSSQGIADLLNNRVDFGATDVFLTESEMNHAKGKILHIPTCIGAVVLTYNLPVAEPINLSKKTLIAILNGKIKKWNAGLIQEENPNINLPNTKIILVHRSDGSGTTYILTRYLSQINNNWKKTYGYGKNIRWATGIGVEGNKNMVKYVSKIPGSLGYVSFTYAQREKLPVARIENEKNKYILPTVETISKAAEIKIPEDARTHLIATKNINSYPISTFSYIIFYKGNTNSRKYKAGKKFFNWMLKEGQKYNESLYYAPVPENVRALISNLLD